MELFMDFLSRFVAQIQSPTLAFLIGGMVVVALGSKLSIPNSLYQFIVFFLLLKIGLKGGIEIREANLAAMALPALFSALAGIIIVLLGHGFFSLFPRVKRADGIATAGLFGAVSASTLAAAMVMLEEQATFFEAWVPALYPFMDIPALVLAILLSRLPGQKAKSGVQPQGQEEPSPSTALNPAHRVSIGKIIKESLQGSALSALLLGLVLGLFTRPDSVLDSFYDPLFRGFLSVMMLILGMEAYSRIHELKGVAHWFGLYALGAPVLHGFIGFALGYIAHITVGFSPGGVVLLAVIAASNSDISGPPTLRAGIPQANPSTYIGASTSIGTPVAIALCLPLFSALGNLVFGA